MTPQPANAHQGAALLDELHTALTRYVILPSPQATELAGVVELRALADLDDRSAA